MGSSQDVHNAVAGGGHSTDKPEFAFGIREIDDFSAQKLMKMMATMVPRDYLVLEVSANLSNESRAEALKLFSPDKFKRVARVVVGSPDKAFLESQHKVMLKQKQERLTKEWKVRKADKDRKKAEKKRQKEMEERKKKAAEYVKKKAEEAAKKKEEEKKKKEAAAKAEADKKAKEEAGDADDGEVKTEDASMEPKEEEKNDDETKEEEPKEEEPDEEPEEPDEEEPVAELSTEEKTAKFAQKPVPDITQVAFNKSLSRFSLPDKGEGFDDVQFEWDKAGAANTYFTNYLVEKKKTTRLDDLKPGEWFKEKVAAWKKTSNDWLQLQKKAKVEEAKKKAAKDKERKAKAAEEGAEVEDEGEPEEPDVFGCENVADVGDGVPLFKDFSFEDWSLVQLRYEMFLLTKAFAKDVDDPDIPGLPEKHFDFYYQKYFGRQLVPKLFGKDGKQPFFDMLADTVKWTDENYLGVQFDGEE